MNEDTPNSVGPDTRTVYIAFALVFGAGMATAIGASVVIFLPHLLSSPTSSSIHNTLLNRYVLASSLGMSAGVMVYVSMIEIFQKSRTAFLDAGYADNLAYIYATSCFFAGVVIMMILNALVTHFLHGHHHHHPDPSPSPGTNNRGNSHHPVTTTAVGEITDGIATRKPPSPRVTTTPTRTPPITNSNNDSIQSSSQQVPPTQQDRPNICYSSDDPVRGLEVLQQMADILVAEHELRERSQMPVGLPSPAQNVTVVSPPNENVDNIETLVELSPLDESTNRNVITVEDGAATNESQVEDDEDVTTHQQQENDAHERQLLFRMSMNTAIAIGLHNFPEGLATFVATLNDPSVGFVLAVAIAIHNIPEGLCVALPVYYATGSRTKAFGWAIFSGLSEPLAAVFGYIILANAVGSTTYGILFGIISGMMVIISTRELLPTAHRYDPTDRVVTYSFIFGMAVLALSLVLFVL